MLLSLAFISAVLATATATDLGQKLHSVYQGGISRIADTTTMQVAETTGNGTRVGNAIMYTISPSHAEL